jgi:hypothetical protein
MAPGSPRPAVAQDLNEALESEIRENGETFLDR